MCSEMKDSGGTSPVPDYSVMGFATNASKDMNRIETAHAKIPELKALKLSVCVGAKYDPATNQVCFTIPIYGDLCVTSPVKIPIGGSIKVCAETCGSFIPTGLKATVYADNTQLFTATVFGIC